MESIEQDILQLIEDSIGCKYIGKLKVEKDDKETPPLWGLFLYLDLEFTPIELAYQGTEDEFKEFIRKEMKTRKMNKIKFWNAIKEYRDE